MKNPNEPLEYPLHYPPTDRWKKFFIGVRWLGPDLSFFKELELQQGARTLDCMNGWEADRKELAVQFGELCQKWLRWRTPYFLPSDRFIVVANGPKFGWIDGLEFWEVIAVIEKQTEKSIPKSYWESTGNKSLGDVLRDIQEMTKKV
jgi:hypothetical protein